MTQHVRSACRMLAAVCLAAASLPMLAKPTAAELDRLGADLTPVGALKAGNADGSIPAWDGGMARPPAGWKPEQGYVDPFASEAPLFTITAQNADQYKDRLSAGMVALLQKYPQFKMPVYRTHRTAVLPKEVTDLVRQQAGKVDLEGLRVRNVGDSAIPFPVPKTGLEVMFNHLMRYLGGGLERQFDFFPVRASGDFYRVGFRERRIWDTQMDQRTEGRRYAFLGFYTAPAMLEGTVYLTHEPMDYVKDTRAAWIYNAGQRRVRRAPDLAFDSVNDGTEGLYFTDQYDAYNGSPERYEWKLVGKREVFVPYNTYKIGDKKLKYNDVLKKGSVNSDLMRYELHRAWVVEATLKTGSKHVFAKRMFYIDEDSWNVLYEDAYDAKGQLWRVALHGLVQFYDAQVPWYGVSVYHDLTNGAYLAFGLSNEVKAPWQFGVKGKVTDFEPDSLRRWGTK